jgi:hypothetical protein
MFRALDHVSSRPGPLAGQELFTHDGVLYLSIWVRWNKAGREERDSIRREFDAAFRVRADLVRLWREFDAAFGRQHAPIT